MSRVPRSFLLIPALLAGAVVLLPLRLWTCPPCGGVVRRLRADPTGCFSCADGGRVSSITRLFRRRADPLLCTLIQQQKGEDDFGRALGELLKRNGSSLSTEDYAGSARFGVCDGEDVVLVRRNQASWMIPGTCRLEVWMFDLQGRLLDAFDGSCSTREGSVSASFIDGAAPGEAVVRIDAGASFVKVEYFGGFSLQQRGKDVRRIAPGGPDCPADWLANGVARFAITGGKFVRILPR